MPSEARRRAGVLMHPTSLHGPWGIGEIGPAAREWLAWLEAARMRVWQVLPLTPVGPYGSPYSSPSSEARESLLLSIDDLVSEGWLRDGEQPDAVSSFRVEWDRIHALRTPALHLAADRVCGQIDLDRVPAPEWVEEWALFAALREKYGGSWTRWPEPLRHRDPDALARARDQHGRAFDRHRALQWLFDRQWGRLREEARTRGIEIWGDVPFFVSLQSNDVWAHPHLWRLDEEGRPLVVSGVPPDAFSETGQLWGHPHYDEAAHRTESFAWWIRRMRSQFDLVDVLRIDHFRGMAQVWEVEAGAEDAASGRWIPGPGRPLLDTLRRTFPDMPFVAEDLGYITPDVRALKDHYGIPGMAVLQFAFALEDERWRNPYLPHRHREDLVVYTGTHDNDTSLGWYRSCREALRDRVRRYLSVPDRDVPFALTRAALRSVAEVAIVPLQDLLQLGSEARMNRPGRAEGNWGWRVGPGALNPVLARAVAEQVVVSGR